MATFVKLTEANLKTPVWVNLDLVCEIRRLKNDVTCLWLVALDENEQELVQVLETPEEILE